MSFWQTVYGDEYFPVELEIPKHVALDGVFSLAIHLDVLAAQQKWMLRLDEDGHGALGEIRYQLECLVHRKGQYAVFRGQQPAYTLRLPSAGSCMLLSFMPVRHVPATIDLIDGKWRLATGEPVVDRVDSHLHPGVADVIQEALAKVYHLIPDSPTEEPEGRKYRVCFDRSLGYATHGRVYGNKWFEARRYGRLGLDRFVVGSEQEETSYVTTCLARNPGGPGYQVMTAYLGGHYARLSHLGLALRSEDYASMIDPDTVPSPCMSGCDVIATCP